MKSQIKGYLDRFTENISFKTKNKFFEDEKLLETISYRAALETLIDSSAANKKPHEIFYGVSDQFWYWLITEGTRRNERLADILPKFPDEFTQETFTGSKGDATLNEAFIYYKLFKKFYKQHRGNIADVNAMLDFGCGWGRFIRFFIKDVDSEKIWGADPMSEMIELCKSQNSWCRFEAINPAPPSHLPGDHFDLIYSYSVFSHLSEQFHLQLLDEIYRILRPGGIYMTTTRSRDFIVETAKMRARLGIDKEHPVQIGTSVAFPDTQKTLAEFDAGKYCFHGHDDSDRNYWGEAAIPKKYVVENWTPKFKLLEFHEMIPQNIIVVQKPFS